ncbi:MAG: carbamoyl phosphate synthase large subunit, partial [Gammaproteobacteria bacterium]
GFEVVATSGTADVLCRHGIPVTRIRKHYEGPSPEGDTIGAIRRGDIALIVNTPFGVGARIDGYEIRTAAVTMGVPCITTVQAFGAAVQGIEAVLAGPFGVRSLQEYGRDLAAARQQEADA